MQRSSECIASLAAALAKAQIELVNPEKSLIGTISSDDPKRAERAFRYASLSSGLDIVRKVLGQHEIATVQTTSVDQTGRHHQSHHDAGARIGRMDRVRLASLFGYRDCNTTPYGSGANLRRASAKQNSR